MALSRRSFFRVLVTAVAAGTLASTPALAIAPANSPDLEPIAETIRMYQELVAFNKLQQAAIASRYNDRQPLYAKSVQEREDWREYTNAVGSKFGQLLSYTMEQFGDGSCTAEDVKTIFSYREPLTVELLRRLPRGVIPVTVAKYVLAYDKMPMNSNLITVWHEFSTKYAPLLFP